MKIITGYYAIYIHILLQPTLMNYALFPPAEILRSRSFNQKRLMRKLSNFTTDSSGNLSRVDSHETVALPFPWPTGNELQWFLWERSHYMATANLLSPIG